MELVVPALAVVSGELDEAAAGVTAALASVTVALLTGTTAAVLPVIVRPGSSFTALLDTCKIPANYDYVILNKNNSDQKDMLTPQTNSHTHQ